jgi:hypothetical protein
VIAKKNARLERSVSLFSVLETDKIALLVLIAGLASLPRWSLAPQSPKSAAFRSSSVNFA